VSLKTNAFKLLEASGISYEIRAEAISDWDDVLENLPYQPIRYLGTWMNFQLANHSGNGKGDSIDLSIVIYSDNSPVSIWPLSVKNDLSVISLSSHGDFVLPPLFVNNCPLKTKKRITKQCIGFLEDLKKLFNIDHVLIGSNLDDNGALSTWHIGWVEKGLSFNVKYYLYVDLSLELSEIKYFFRKSYKSLISEGEREWSIYTHDNSIEHHLWEEFRALHFEVAGRVTRSKDSWDSQLLAIRQQEAFLITLRDKEDKLVGGGYFQLSSDEGIYAVGVYKRELFEKPLGHVVQMKAIEELKRRGCKWYEIGQRFYPSDSPTPSKKELSISHFKEGFSTHVKPKFFCSTLPK